MQNQKLSKEQISFDTRVALEVMEWRELDENSRDSFDKHVLPKEQYPFFETFSTSSGCLVYHPTPYHSQVFSPSTNIKDDIATLIVLLSKRVDIQSGMLSMLHLIHYQRSMQDAGFVPADDFYRSSRYYQSGDFAKVALHLVHSQSNSGLNIATAFGQKYVGRYGIVEIISNSTSEMLIIKCNDSSKIPEEVMEDLESYGYKIILRDLRPE